MAYLFRSMIYFDLSYCVYCERRIKFSWFCLWLFNCLTQIVEKILFSSLNCQVALLRINWQPTCGSVSGLCLITLLYRLILMPVPNSLSYYSLLLLVLKLGSANCPTLFLFFNCSGIRVVYGSLGLLHFHINLRISLSISMHSKNLLEFSLGLNLTLWRELAS